MTVTSADNPLKQTHINQTDNRFSVAVQFEDFDLNTEHTHLVSDDRGIGAVVAFIGMVRDLNLADDVVALELEPLNSCNALIAIFVCLIAVRIHAREFLYKE